MFDEFIYEIFSIFELFYSSLEIVGDQYANYVLFSKD